jgi:FMN phosphatase YigB (HAD superfamily)
MYFGLLAKKLAPKGYEPKKLIAGIWSGTQAMIGNDGSKTNEEAFWQDFCKGFGEEARQDMPFFDEFYRKEFLQIQQICGFRPEAAQVIHRLQEKSFTIALATNPIFPGVATENRIRWAGLEPSDFALYTTYENSRFCKPNLAYYEDILAQLRVSPEECLMVGNDVAEDMVAQKLGMEVFLLTDCLINKPGADIAQFAHGGFPELLERIETL